MYKAIKIRATVAALVISIWGLLVNADFIVATCSIPAWCCLPSDQHRHSLGQSIVAGIGGLFNLHFFFLDMEFIFFRYSA